MSEDITRTNLVQASQHFEQAHFQAILAGWLARIAGQNIDLFSYEEVRSILQAREVNRQPELKDVPLDKIVGSVGRYRDFTQAFLPRHEALEERWTRVDAAMHGLLGVPPIDLYQVGELYFVRDGNHRVSVARAHGDKTIEAYVTPVEAPFPVEADSASALSAWLVEAGHRLFLQNTRLQAFFPDADVRLTEPGRYRELYEHIDVHRWYMGEAQEREIPYEEAVQSWYSNVYMPLAAAIRESNVLREFPNRTEADLYLWICQHREELREAYDLDLNEAAAVSTFASVYSDRTLSKVLKGARMAVARLTGGDDVVLGMPRPDSDAGREAKSVEG